MSLFIDNQTIFYISLSTIFILLGYIDYLDKKLVNMIDNNDKENNINNNDINNNIVNNKNIIKSECDIPVPVHMGRVLNFIPNSSNCSIYAPYLPHNEIISKKNKQKPLSSLHIVSSNSLYDNDNNNKISNDTLRTRTVSIVENFSNRYISMYLFIYLTIYLYVYISHTNISYLNLYLYHIVII
jgi:hypothetical protein